MRSATVREIKYLRSSLWVLHKKFDKLPETKRFMWMLGLMFVGIVGINSHEYTESVIFTAVSAVYMCLLALSRIGYIDGWLLRKKK